MEETKQKQNDSKVDSKKDSKQVDSKQVNRDLIDMLLQKGIDFYITDKRRNWYYRILYNLPILKRKKRRRFIIYPLVLDTNLEISKILIDIDFKELDKFGEKPDTETHADLSEYYDVAIKNIIENTDKIVAVIAYAILNRKEKPPKRLLKYLSANLTNKELYELLIVVLQGMDPTHFLASIVSVKGMRIIGAN